MNYIYTLSHPLTNEVRYVGKTTSPKRRYSEHIYKLNKTDHKTNWIKSLLKEGLKPVMNIIEVCEDNFSEREKFWITQFPNLTNLTDGGESFTMSEKTKEKLRRFNIGKKLSEETKEKLRRANTGKNNPRYGLSVPMSEATKEKISKALINKYKDIPKKSKPFRSNRKPCIIDNIQYESIGIASKKIGIPRGTIHRRLKSKNFTMYIWG